MKVAVASMGTVPEALVGIWAVVGIMSLHLLGCAPQVETRVPTPAPSPTPTHTLVVMPSPTCTPRPTLIPMPTEEATLVRFTIVYDNNGYDAVLRTAWGFACWVETPEGTVLFDTGGDGPTLLGNLAQLGLDPQAIDAVVLSHSHGDHTGGLAALLDTGVTPTVYVPAAFPASFKEDVRARIDLVEVTGPVKVLPGIHTTGQVGSSIVEQALVVETGDGPVVITGCAHPGVVEMVRRAQEVVGGEVALVMGGFHLKDTGQAQIEAIIADLCDLGVQRVAPCHCTGDAARRVFAEASGAEFFPAGVGWTITFRAK